MTITPASTAAYIENLPDDRREPMRALCDVFRKHFPEGFEETIAYGMVSFCVPHSTYPAGYHCDPKIALPFVQIASQKKHLAIYHMGLYAIPEDLDWFQEVWAASTKDKLDMGKSCIRLNPAKPIPVEVFAELAKRISVARWIEVYEKMRPAGKRAG
jgi:hypothetical protein